MKTVLNTKEKQKASLEALIFLHSFCKDKGLIYYLAYGTLIGAVRHHGFIPWDDDVDVFVPRPDYEKLLMNFNDPSGTFKLCTCFNNPTYVLPYAKIQNMKTIRISPDGTILDEGIGIDLFPLDGISSDIYEAEQLFRKENEKFRHIVQRYDRLRYTQPKDPISFLKSVAGKTYYKTGYLKRIGQQISKNPFHSDYNNCSKVVPAIGVHSGAFRVFEKEWFEPIEMEFEGIELVGPKGYDKILRIIYGDYMIVPPEGERASTHQEEYAWRKTIADIKQNNHDE